MINKKKNVDAEYLNEISLSSKSAAEAARRLGMPFSTYKRYAEKLNVYKTNKPGKGIKNINPYEILYRLENSNYQISGKRIKDTLFKLGIKEEKCEICNLKYWNGHIIPLELHHIDGNNLNNRLDNFQILCPNCHSLTDNFRGRKNKVIKDIPISKKLISITKTKENTRKKNEPGQIKSKPKLVDKFCKNCGKQLNERQTNFCSYTCNNTWREQGIPKAEELKGLLEKYKNFSAIGRIKGVSGVAVKKWFIKYGLYKKGMIGLGNG